MYDEVDDCWVCVPGFGDCTLCALHVIFVI